MVTRPCPLPAPASAREVRPCVSASRNHRQQDPCGRGDGSGMRVRRGEGRLPVMIVDCSVYRGGLRTAGPSDLVGALDLARSSDGGFVWIGLYKPTVEEFALVRRGFGLHPLAVEDALEAHQRPKLEVYDDSLFVVLKPVVYEPGKDTASRIYTFKRQIQEFRRATGPLAMPLIRLAAMGSAGGPGPGSGGPGPLPLALPTVDEAIKPFFRDVSDHVTRVNESVDSLDRLVSDALSAYLAQVGVRQNDDMRKTPRERPCSPSRRCSRVSTA